MQVGLISGNRFVFGGKKNSTEIKHDDDFAFTLVNVPSTSGIISQKNIYVLVYHKKNKLPFSFSLFTHKKKGKSLL